MTRDISIDAWSRKTGLKNRLMNTLLFLCRIPLIRSNFRCLPRPSVSFFLLALLAFLFLSLKKSVERGPANLIEALCGRLWSRQNKTRKGLRHADYGLWPGGSEARISSGAFGQKMSKRVLCAQRASGSCVSFLQREDRLWPINDQHSA